jgi:putative transposase
MIPLEDRRLIAAAIEEARAAGARLEAACELAGIDVRTLQRWQAGEGLVNGDRRPEAVREPPAHALTPQEREQILAVVNEPRFAELPPARIVPMLADEGTYIASESSFHRVMRDAGQNQHRGRAKAPRKRRPPSTHVASGPRQVFCWDVTYLPALVTGVFWYLYVILDVFSRKIVGHEVYDSDHSDHAMEVLRRTALAEGVAMLPEKPVLHGDNGPTIKATTVLALMDWLGVRASHSRPRVSNDNPYAESLFHTAKYRPEFPAQGFADLEQARQWASEFVRWYNYDHRHSGIRYVSPAQRHAGEDRAILEAREGVYEAARARNPRRWTRGTRNWTYISVVTLNPERDEFLNTTREESATNTPAAEK